MQGSIIIVQTTVSSEIVARKIAKELVADGLAACAQVGQEVTSYYYWDGELCEEGEWPVSFKVSVDRHEQFKDRLLELHPYDVPQYCYSQVACTEEYGKWVDS